MVQSRIELKIRVFLKSWFCKSLGSCEATDPQSHIKIQRFACYFTEIINISRFIFILFELNEIRDFGLEVNFDFGIAESSKKLTATEMLKLK